MQKLCHNAIYRYLFKFVTLIWSDICIFVLKFKKLIETIMLYNTNTN